MHSPTSRPPLALQRAGSSPPAEHRLRRAPPPLGGGGGSREALGGSTRTRLGLAARLAASPGARGAGSPTAARSLPFWLLVLRAHPSCVCQDHLHDLDCGRLFPAPKKKNPPKFFWALLRRRFKSMFAGISGQGSHDDRGFWGCFWGCVFCCCYPCLWYRQYHERKADNKRYHAKLAEKAASADAASAPGGVDGAV